jgi:hypothetical protein
MPTSLPAGLTEVNGIRLPIRGGKRGGALVPDLTMAEWGNWVADGIAGRARKMAEKEEQEWVELVS